MNISLLITRSIAFTVIANVLAMIGQERAIGQPDLIFRSIASDLKDQLPQGWKLRLPSSIQVKDYQNQPISLFSRSDGFSSGSLRVSLDTQSGCTSRACQMGSIFVERGSSFLGNLKSNPIFSKSDLERVRSIRSRNYETWTDADRQLMLRAEGAVLERETVDLGSQVKGTFVYRNAMGVSTGSSIIVTWNQDGQIYTISLRGGLNNKKEIIDAAKSMVKESPIGETEVADDRSNIVASNMVQATVFKPISGKIVSLQKAKDFHLPKLVPIEYNNLYPVIENVQEGSFRVVLGNQPDCHSNSCQLANFDMMLDSYENQEWFSKKIEDNDKFKLGSGIDGFYSVNKNGSRSGAKNIVWKKNGHVFYLSMRLGTSREDVIATAKSMYEASQTSSQSLTPIAPSGSYAYPSPEEFAQFKKGLKPSPLSLSATERKARQDFQAEWQKKNRAIAPYVGAWKTADNQDVYVFPSKVAGRVCVLRSKDGQLSPDLGVSMTTDMRYDGNNGLFKVDTPEVVAGRSGKTQPLSAFYGAIGSPDVSSIRGELEQAQCVSELPKGIVVAKKDPVVKPITVSPNPELMQFTDIGSIEYVSSFPNSSSKTESLLFGPPHKSSLIMSSPGICDRDICIFDVRQGKLGDCYFLASLAGIAHYNPSFVREMIRDNNDGTYTIRFFNWNNTNSDSTGLAENPTPIYIRVDAKLPQVTSSQSTAYAAYTINDREDSLTASTPDEKGIGRWVALIEKAHAIFRDQYPYPVDIEKNFNTHGYGRINRGGDSTYPLSEMTGKAAQEFSKEGKNFPSIEDLDKLLYREKRIIVVGSSEIPNISISSSHAYAVASVDRINKTITLYNPWGPETEKSNPKKKYGVFQKTYKEFVNDFSYVMFVDNP